MADAHTGEPAKADTATDDPTPPTVRVFRAFLLRLARIRDRLLKVFRPRPRPAAMPVAGKRVAELGQEHIAATRHLREAHEASRAFTEKWMNIPAAQWGAEFHAERERVEREWQVAFAEQGRTHDALLEAQRAQLPERLAMSPLASYVAHLHELDDYWSEQQIEHEQQFLGDAVRNTGGAGGSEAVAQKRRAISGRSAFRRQAKELAQLGDSYLERVERHPEDEDEEALLNDLSDREQALWEAARRAEEPPDLGSE